MTSRRPAALLAVLLALLGSVLLVAPASAAEQVITITAEGVTPKVLEVAAGDTITFVNEDTTFSYRAEATSDNWDLDSGPVGLLPGRSYTHPDPITEAGTYTYRVAEGEPYAGSVLLRGANAVRPTPSRRASAAPAQPKPAASTPSPGAPSPGAGTTGQPPLGGGFGAPAAPAPPATAAAALPPAIALPQAPGASAGPLPEAAPEPAGGPLAVPGRLGAPAGYRGYGLPAALGAVLIAGVASLLVRLLLAEPAAARRRGRRELAGPAPVPAVD